MGAHRVLPFDASMTNIPPRTDVKIGFACNNKCVFCAQGNKRKILPTLKFEDVVERMTRAREHADSIVLTGGEPTVHKRIIEIVAAAKRLGFTRIQIQTNGRLLSQQRVLGALLHAGANEFSPSIHGSTAEIHDGLTLAPGSFEQTLQGLRNLAAAGVSVITNSVITQSNTADLPALVELLGSVGMRNCQLAFVHAVGTALELVDEVMPRFTDVLPHLRQARDVARRYDMRLVTEAIPLCMLRGMEDLAVEETIPQMTVFDLDGGGKDYTAWREDEGKAHGPPCEACALRSRCEGPWREYPDQYGWDELVPFEKPVS